MPETSGVMLPSSPKGIFQHRETRAEIEGYSWDRWAFQHHGQKRPRGPFGAPGCLYDQPVMPAEVGRRIGPANSLEAG